MTPHDVLWAVDDLRRLMDDGSDDGNNGDNYGDDASKDMAT